MKKKGSSEPQNFILLEIELFSMNFRNEDIC